MKQANSKQQREIINIMRTKVAHSNQFPCLWKDTLLSWPIKSMSCLENKNNNNKKYNKSQLIINKAFVT